MSRILEWEEALSLLNKIAHPLPPKKVPLAEAAGLVLAEEITSPVSFPPFPRSRVDGYALGPSLSQEYRLVGEVPAGGGYPKPLGPGEAVRIFTGAPVPRGTIGILPQEWAQEEGKRLHLPFKVDPIVLASLIQKVGEEIEQGEKILVPGMPLTPPEIGLLAALGFREVTVRPQPQVALVAVGSELRDIGEWEESTIPSSNLFALEASLRLDGVQVYSFPPVPDDLKNLVSLIRSKLDLVDLVITCGGTGEGKYDFTARAFIEVGAEFLFTRVNFRPGGRIIVARVGSRFLVGLPGMPSAALVAFHLLVRPLIKALAGKELRPCFWKGILVEQVGKERRQRVFLYARARNVQGIWELTPVNLGQGALKAGIGANALVDLPPGTSPIPRETEVNFIPLNYGPLLPCPLEDKSNI
ncbi:molybdopterin molybdotransferase [Thermanaeromonas toyohensis ToBE]|uniref:Molybdopterin molybdenumtransferase n=1 Tax=Thermanaeromonas toyohensis ToBE TaxID=698762 RepID=A0A1W1W1X0_9FIRM|nr:molybdopterin molybdotransferase MoeA [Thermanaeromonas toyohensis]SMB99094.1 molybdopterin molybdotransferase [Thermanaeromonas toyohensis ToBE]